MFRTLLLRAAAATTPLMLVAPTAHAVDYVWAGDSEGGWDIPTNWQPEGVPGPGDTASIGQDEPYAAYEVTVNGSTSVLSLTMDGGSDLVLGADVTLEVTGDVLLSAGSPPGGGIDFALVGGSGTLVVNDGFFELSGFIDEASLVVNGTFQSLEPGGCDGGPDNSITINGTVVVHHGGAVFGGSIGSLLINDGGELVVRDDARVEASSSPDVPGFVNHGTIRSVPGDGPNPSVERLRESDGLIIAEAGSVLVLNNPSSSNEFPSLISGPIMVESGATLVMTGGLSHVISGTVTGDGTMEIAGEVTFDNVDLGLPLVQVNQINGGATTNVIGTNTFNDVSVLGTWDFRGSGSCIVNGTFSHEASFNLNETAELHLAGPAMLQDNIAVGATLRISGDAELVDVSGSLSMSGPGKLQIDPDGVLTLVGAPTVQVFTDQEQSVNNGTIIKTGAGTAEFPNNFGDGVMNNGLIDIQEGAIRQWMGGTHTGDVTLAEGTRYELSPSGAQIMWDASGSITGDGTFQMMPIHAEPEPVLDCLIDVSRIELDGSIKGDAAITCDVLIQDALVGGTVTAVVRELHDWNSGGVVDSATIRVLGQCDVGPGGVGIYHSARVEIAGQLDWTGNGAIAGSSTDARLAVLPGGRVNIINGERLYPTFENAGTIRVEDPDFMFQRSAQSTNNGIIEVVGGPVNFRNGAPAQGPGGVVLLNGTAAESLDDPTLDFTGGLIAGNGSLLETVNLASTTLLPGLSPGELTVAGALSMDDDSAMVIELGGSVPGLEHDLVTVAGNATVNGLLLVGYVDGYEPLPGDTFTIVQANSVSGAFIDVVGSGAYEVVYGPDSITLVVIDADVTCPGDLNGDGEINVGDLLLLLSDWGPCGEPCVGDLDGDGLIGVTDLLELLAGWGPCPENVLYDVTFSSPLHTVGESPTVGAGQPTRETVSSLGPSGLIGAPPLVVESAGGLDDQPLLFSFTETLSSTARFSLQDLPDSKRYRVELDVSIPVMQTAGGFCVCLRYGSAVLVRASFQPNDQLELVIAGTTVATEYIPGTPMTLRFDVDAEANAAEIYIDDLSTHAGTVETSASPSQIECYALNGWFFLPNTGGEAVIDNVKITAIE